MSKQNKNKKAVHRILDSVWTLEYKQISDTTVELIGYSRDDAEGYEREDALEKGDVVEDPQRTVIGLSIAGRHYVVTNPKHVFDYKVDGPEPKVVQTVDDVEVLRQRLQNLSDGGLITGFAIHVCTNKTGSTITCYFRNERQALAVKNLLESCAQSFDCSYQHTKRNGGEQFNLVIVFND